MKLRWKIVLGLAALGAVGAFLLLRPDGSGPRSVEETRRALRQQGFKTDLTEFNFSTSAELRARAAALTGTSETLGRAPWRDDPALMKAVGSNSALVAWKQEHLESQLGEDLWPALRQRMIENRSELDAACDAALSGPISFDLDARAGNAMLLRHLSAMKSLTQTLGSRAVLELHDENKDAAWTNLLAATRLVTAWEPESVEISELVRSACTAIAFNTTWQALQADGWTDERLAKLLSEWETVDFFKKLPETAAFTRACMAADCQLERQQPLRLGPVSVGVLRSPQYVLGGLAEYWRELSYRHQGSYEDEKALLLYYRDRELELRRAAQCPTWAAMRLLPGITNVITFQSKYRSPMQARMNVRRIGLRFQDQGRGLLGRTAEAEARRRLTITAIALERYRGRFGSYPKTLQELVPGLLKNPPTDFMDGQPLRYRLTDDGHFVLYSVGLDCVDNSGVLPRRGRRGSPIENTGEFAPPQGNDLVWPRPASAADAELVQQEEKKAREEQMDRSEEMQAAEWWKRTARRQAKVGQILNSGRSSTTRDAGYRGRPLSEVLRNPITAETNKLSLADMLALKQIVTGTEPETVTFELPVNYDVLTNLGSLCLLIDPCADEDSHEGFAAGQMDVSRATNGDCLLVWSTIYESPGEHALQAGLLLNAPTTANLNFVEDIPGPLSSFVVTNLCQFSLSSANFYPEKGATIHAKLPELNGAFTIELNSPAGERLKTITGSTSNGVIKEHWNLIDESGKKFQGDSFDSVFTVTLPDSGRSQRQKGP